MYFIFLLCLVANSSAFRTKHHYIPPPQEVVACSYLENIGNWMLRVTHSIDTMCKDKNTNQRDVATTIKNRYREHFQKIDDYSGLHILSSYIGRMGFNLRENDIVAREAILHFDDEWQNNISEDARERIKEYFRNIINYGTDLDKAMAYRIMRYLPDNNKRIKQTGFLRTITTSLTEGYKNIIVDPVYISDRSPRVLIIHAIITLSNILGNPDLLYQDHEKITILYDELISLPFATDDHKKIVDLKTIGLLDVLDNVWKKLSGEIVLPFTMVERKHKTKIRNIWDRILNSMSDLWKISHEGAHPPCEDIVREHFGRKLREVSPSADWLRSLRTGDRKEKFEEEGGVYYFLGSILYPIEGWGINLGIINTPEN